MQRQRPAWRRAHSPIATHRASGRCCRVSTPRTTTSSARPTLATTLSRANLAWGVSVPWDESHVFYVWFDALLNYYTALSFAREGEDLTGRFWPASFHVIARDILKFHTLLWPAMLLAAGIEPPRHVFVHGY